jgi:hypothetical protein
MKRITQLAVGALMLAGTAVGFTAPADAHVSIGIGVGVPIYPGYYPPGPCYSYNYYYDGYCGYDTYYDPVFIDGDWYSGRHYYRRWHGEPEVWFRGRWHSDFRGGWRGDDDWGHHHDRGWDHRDRHHDHGDWDGHDHHDHW